MPDMPPFPGALDPPQLEALRDLTIYALGALKYGDLFPEDASDGLERPSDQDIRRFKEGSPLNKKPEVLRTVYTRIYQFFAAEPSRRRNLKRLLQRVYPTEDENSRLEEAAQFFYSYFSVNSSVMQELTRALRGVYYLYRFGERSMAGDAEGLEGDAEYVKSVLLLRGRVSDGLQWLEFRLTYRAGKKGEQGQRHRMKGVVVPIGKYIYFLGADEGMLKGPCLMIGLLPNTSETANKLTGTLLRLNTLYIISAARTASLRIPETDPSQDLEALYAAHEKSANIHSRDEAVFEAEFRAILEDIDNTVDGSKQRTLRG